MLETRFEFPFEDENAYELSIPRCANWSSAKTKVLVLLQTVDSRDLKAKGMLGDKMTRLCFNNAMKFTQDHARTYDEKAGRGAAYCVAPFNRRRHLNLKGQARKSVEQDFATHAHKLIRKIKPTHVLVSGDEAFHALWPKIENHTMKRGWVHELTSGDVKLKVCSTLDFSRLLEKKGEYANLLGFWCRHFANLLLGDHQHSLKGFDPSPFYVDTMDKFKQLMKRLWTEEIIATDTETRDLSVLSNAIYTIQFALESNPERGYVLPIDHPLQDCWSKDDRKYIKSELKKFFGYMPTKKKPKKTLIGFNLMFDLRVIRRALKLPIIWHDVWEITAGEHNLDENITELKNFNSKPGNLAAVLCSYENDFYYRAAFSKEDRANTGSTNPRDKDFLRYGAMDVQSLVLMRRQQIRLAAHQDIEGRSYKPYFIRHVLHQMGDTAHQLSHLREDGSLIDVKYLRHLVSPESPLRSEMKRLAKEFRRFPQVQEANQRVLGASGLKARGLFGKAKANAKWALSMTKPTHLRTLFFDVMGMEPVNETTQGEQSVDKAFVAENEARNPIVAAYGEHAKLGKLMSTYAKGWLKKIRANKDSAEDQHLRADYSFFDVATGRLNSKAPNLQQIPSRGKLAKIIKKMFIARKGTLLIRYDYSAHEVRVWSYVGKDQVLAGIFKVGQKLRQMFIVDPSEANAKAIKEKGDIHILNVKRLLNKVVDKSSPLRDAIKAVIFGLLYGKSAETLGEDTKLGDKQALMKIIGNKETTPKDRDKAETDLAALMAEDRKDYAQGLIDKVFAEFKGGAKWTRKMGELVASKYYVYSPIGRMRRLYAAMTGDRGIVNQQIRRGSNAPIQGFASEIGIKAGRLIMELYYKELPKFCEMMGLDYDPWEMRVPYNRVVHDANYFSVIYKMVIPFTHIVQYAATYGVTKVYKDEFNVEFPVEPEIEMEFGVRDDSTFKWDWSLPNIVDSIIKSVDHAQEIGVLEGDRQDVLREIFAPWRNKEMRAYLQERYPLLGVDDLNKQIVEAIRPIYVIKREDKCKTKKTSGKQEVAMS